MTVTDQVKDRKLKQKEAQHDLQRKAAKISTVSPENLNKSGYMTGEDMSILHWAGCLIED